MYVFEHNFEIGVKSANYQQVLTSILNKKPTDSDLGIKSDQRLKKGNVRTQFFSNAAQPQLLARFKQTSYWSLEVSVLCAPQRPKVKNVSPKRLSIQKTYFTACIFT